MSDKYKFPMPDGSKIGPYEACYGDRHRHFGGDLARFRLFASGAFNANGLIGSEYNGIVVLDEHRLQVVADKLCAQSSGWYGSQQPYPSTMGALDMLTECSDEEFVDVLMQYGRCRYEVSDFYLRKTA